jgi:AAA15 family ATPase/GTPase
MVDKITISNFRSIKDLSIELGRINILIGENGCGKTNILEAIGVGALAFQYKTDHEFFESRGIRATDNSAHFFNENKPAKITFSINQFKQSVSATISATDNGSLESIPGVDFDNKKLFKSATFARFENWEEIKNELNFKIGSLEFLEPEVKKGWLFTVNQFETSGLFKFLRFCPEYSKIKQFVEAKQILPLGIMGEGLFRQLQKLQKTNPKKLEEINELLKVIDWFSGLDFPPDLFHLEKRIAIKDKYLGSNPDMLFLHQNLANEGFLFLLFYFTLFVSDDTPKFFAIDNIDNALNPKLCVKLMHTLNDLALKYKKQVIFTTHNPSVLDGLDLSDDGQRLFVVYRAEGATVAKRHLPKEGIPGVPPPRLSESFLRGYLGGLPKSF